VVAKRKIEGDKGHEPEQGFPGNLFAEALRATAENPSDESLWVELEDAAASRNAGEQLLALYRRELSGDLLEPIRELLSRRAVRFAGDSFGENTQPVIDLLRGVIAAAPNAGWAFEHLVVALTMNERWPELLDVHDARLAATKDPARRKELLDEASHIAKDFVGDHARAIGYLDQLFRLRPSDLQVASSLERLLERQERWEDLVSFWRQRAETLAGPQAHELQRRIVSVLYEKLHQPDAALVQARTLLTAEPEDSSLPLLLERVLLDDRTPRESRLAALDLLRERHDAAGTGGRVPELLQIAIGFTEGEDLRRLRRECGERRFALGDVAGALDQYEALVCLAPEDREVEDRLRQLSETAREPGRLARALTAAASRCGSIDRRIELLTRAARVHDRQLGNRIEAVALLEEAIGHPAAPSELRVETLRRLEEIFAELGDDGKRLHALERLGAVEPRPGEQRLVWARAAELAARMGEVDRALAAWDERLELDPTDGQALAAEARLLAAAARWQDLISLLERRVASAPAPHQVRADLVEMATVTRDKLHDLARATETWREISTRFGEDQQSVSALADLYGAQSRFSELAELLCRNSLVDRERHTAMLARLADALRERLDDRRGAVDWYRRALEVDPAHAVARAGLSALLEDANVAPAAAEPLALAAEKTGSWELLLELLPHRLGAAAQNPRRARLLEEAAALVEGSAGDQARAFEWYCQALPLDATNLSLRRNVLRLAEATGTFARAARALEEALASGEVPPVLASEIAEQRGQLLELRLQDLESARASYAQGLTLQPERLELRVALVRTATRLGRWAEAAAALVDPGVPPGVREAKLLPLFESVAAETGGLPRAAAALGQVVASAPDLPAALRRDLQIRVAGHYLGPCPDPQAAAAALESALTFDPRHVPTLLLLAELQRARPDRALWQTLIRLAEEQPGNLDHLHEASELALGSLRDETLAEKALERLWIEATRLLRLSSPAAGRNQAEEAASFALEKLVALHTAAVRPERVRRAIALLLEGARLPLIPENHVGWLRRAAELCESPLDDKAAAIDIWRLIAEEAPGAATAREALVRLHEDLQRYAAAAALRVAELESTTEADRRLGLRLEIVRLQALAEKQTSQSDLLRSNLAEQPGHVPSMRTLTEVLIGNGRSAELGDILEQQAHILEDRGEARPSAALWAQLARLAEQRLDDPERARAAWERVTELDVTCEALDSLGALRSASGDFAAAAAWLERRLNMTEGEPRIDVTGRLAQAYLAAGQRHRAVACLERTLSDFPRAEGLRTLLADLYRAAQSHEQLARILAEGCEHIDDQDLFVTRARAAAELYAGLGLLGRAVPLLEKAVRIVPADESLRSALAEGLAQGGRRAEARALLLELIDEAGWRRSRKRALLHQRLARVARAEGDLPFALEHFEHASSMDVSNHEILAELAEVAEASGAGERAERAYRAWLVLKRKDSAGETDSAPTGVSLAVTEVLLRLHDLAAKRGQSNQAAELLDSALAAAMGDAAEADRLQKALLERGAHDALARLFEKRREYTAGSPAEAEVYAQMASGLRAQDRVAEAFEAQILAIQAAPELREIHQGAARLAREQNRVPELVDRLVTLASRRRRRPDAGVATALLLQAAELAESDLGDPARALELYRRAEETESQSVEVWSGLGRLAEKRGDLAEGARIVALLKQKATEAGEARAAADALYRAAAIELQRPETRESGMASLNEALVKSPEVDRAMALVAAAGLPQPELVKILPLYEHLARTSGDDEVLFDYLERRANSASPTAAEVREAVDLAMALGRSDRALALLLRLADQAVNDPERKGDVTWALLELVQRQKASGDFEAAARNLDRAAPHLDSERVLALARDLGERAARSGNLRLGAQLLEGLRARTPADEALWRPLLAHYLALQDRAGVDRLVGETLPLLLEPAKRNELRLTRARFLLASDERDPLAAEALRDVLLEEPRHPEAMNLLADYYQCMGAESDLCDLLEQCFEQRAELGDRDGAVQAALRLGDVLERVGGDRAGALYERALGIWPGQRELLKRLLQRTPAEAITALQAILLEDLLASEVGAGAARLAETLVEVWTRLGNEAAVLRVLERGAALAPADMGLTGQLERWYRVHDAWAPLADLLAAEASRQSDSTEAAALLCEAATIRRTRLQDASGALALLRQARERAPEDTDVLGQLARVLVVTRQSDAAVGEVQNALDRLAPGHERRLPLLLLRAELLNLRGDRRAAVASLRQAQAVSPEAVFETLTETLVAWRKESAAAGDTDGLRDATLTLADLLRSRGALAEARQFVYELLAGGETSDPQTIRLSCELAQAAGDLEGALAAAMRLLPLTQGEAQAAAAEQLALLAEQVGRPTEAMAPIEAALAAGNGDPRLVTRLAELYEATGAESKLAQLLYEHAQRGGDEADRFRQFTRAGALFVRSGDSGLALMALNEAQALRPNDPEAMLLLSDAYALAGALQESANLLQPLIAAHKGKASPALADLYVRIARIAARAGDAKSELQALSRALDADKKNGAVATELADRAEALQDYDLATKALRIITVHQATGSLSTAVAFLRQARIAHRRGETDRAILFARRAVQEAVQGDPVVTESQEFLRSVGAG
jgi:Tfp pilus assembly protein PilF/Flp pilus assembly protein TadD